MNMQMERTTTSKHLYLMAFKLTSTWRPQWIHVWFSRDAPVNVLWLNLLLGFSNKPSGDFRWFSFCKTRHNLSFNPAFPPTSWGPRNSWNIQLDEIISFLKLSPVVIFTPYTKPWHGSPWSSAIRIPDKPYPALKTHGPARIWPSCFLKLEGYHSVCVPRYLKSYYVYEQNVNEHNILDQIFHIIYIYVYVHHHQDMDGLSTDILMMPPFKQKKHVALALGCSRFALMFGPSNRGGPAFHSQVMMCI